MKNSKRMLTAALVMAMVGSSIFPSLPANAVAKTKTLTCTKKLTVTVGSKKKVKVKKKKGMKIKKKTFKSSNKKVATVNKKGIVKGKKAGACKIKATVKYRYKKKLRTKKFTIKVKVKAKTPVTKPSTTSSVSTAEPGQTPVATNTTAPTQGPTDVPTTKPTVKPTDKPANPTQVPTDTPIVKPTQAPTDKPANPTKDPAPSTEPTDIPTTAPTTEPTPTITPTTEPTAEPTPTEKPLDYNKNGVVVENGELVDGVSASGAIVIPIGTKSIAKRAFYENANALSFDIPNTVETIDDEAFGYCTEITELYIPESVESVGNGIVKGCSKLKTFTIANPNCVIGRDIVAECPALDECKLPIKTDTCTHDYSDTGRVIKDPTCIETGLGLYICKHCGDQQQVKINALGHVESKDKVVDAVATCTQEGSSHTYCTICGTTMTVTTQPKLTHEYEKKVIKQATCTSDGLEGFVCKNCGDVQNAKTIPAIGHSYNWRVIIDDYDYDQCGDYVLRCDNCGGVEEEYDVVNATFSGYDSNTHKNFSFTGIAVVDKYYNKYGKIIFIIQDTGSTADLVIQEISNRGYGWFTNFEISDEIDGENMKYFETSGKGASSCFDIYCDRDYFPNADDNKATLGAGIDVDD